MKSIRVYPEPDHYNVVGTFIANNVGPDDTLELHMNASPRWILVETGNADTIIEELQKAGVRYTVA